MKYNISFFIFYLKELLIAFFSKHFFRHFFDLPTKITFDWIELLTWNFHQILFDVNSMYWTKHFFLLCYRKCFIYNHVRPHIPGKKSLSLKANLVHTKKNTKKLIRSKHPSTTKEHICKVWKHLNNPIMRYLC